MGFGKAGGFVGVRMKLALVAVFLATATIFYLLLGPGSARLQALAATATRGSFGHDHSDHDHSQVTPGSVGQM